VNNTVSYKTAVCADYEILLKECQAALEACDDHMSGKEVDDELLRLQAAYAKAWATLRRHVRDCEVCQFFAKSSAHNSDHSHDASAEEGYSLEDSRPSQTLAKEE
jgi:hypothetical protein